MATQAASATIDQLIINSPYDEPHEHWSYHRETRAITREPERRKAGYVRASESLRIIRRSWRFRRTATGEPESARE